MAMFDDSDKDRSRKAKGGARHDQAKRKRSTGSRLQAEGLADGACVCGVRGAGCWVRGEGERVPNVDAPAGPPDTTTAGFAFPFRIPSGDRWSRVSETVCLSITPRTCPALSQQSLSPHLTSPTACRRDRSRRATSEQRFCRMGIKS